LFPKWKYLGGRKMDMQFVAGIAIVVVFFVFVEYMKKKDGKRGPIKKLIDKFK